MSTAMATVTATTVPTTMTVPTAPAIAITTMAIITVAVGRPRVNVRSAINIRSRTHNDGRWCHYHTGLIIRVVGSYAPRKKLAA